jgi:hypothetical protein
MLGGPHLHARLRAQRPARTSLRPHVLRRQRRDGGSERFTTHVLLRIGGEGLDGVEVERARSCSTASQLASELFHQLSVAEVTQRSAIVWCGAGRKGGLQWLSAAAHEPRRSCLLTPRRSPRHHKTPSIWSCTPRAPSRWMTKRRMASTVYAFGSSPSTSRNGWRTR